MPTPQLLTQGPGVFTLQALQAVNALISSQGILTPGNVWWVKPISGSDLNDGLSPATALRTLTQAQTNAVANQNDVVLLCAEGNTAASTTSYQSGTLNWAKSLVHLIGINAGPLFSQRSRIAFQAAYATASNLFTLSGNGCLIAGIEMFMGVASVLPTGCMSISGQRNVIRKCHIAGMGAATNDISGAYSLQLNDAEENLFEDGTNGQDTVQLGAGTSNSVLLFSNNGGTGCTRNVFRGCRFMLDTSSATACLFLRSGATAMDRENIMEDCLFLNAINSGSTTLTHAMAVVAGTSPAGVLILTGSKTGLFGASGWNATSAIVYATGGVQPTNTTWGLATALTS
jgi:hypothetical protein